MAIDRSQLGSGRQWILLAGLVVALAVFLWGRQGGDGTPAGRGGVTSYAQAPKTGGARQPAEELDVKLDALEAQRAEPTEGGRNPFRFEARRAPRSTGSGTPAREPAYEPPVAPAGPASPPPIPLKFIGIVEAEAVGRVAALSDGRNVFHGRPGDIIEGRYRIVRIGTESIVLEYVDTGVQQTIRLSGS